MTASGPDSAAVQAVYDHLYAAYLAGIPAQRTEILWSGPLYIVLFATVLGGFFGLLALALRHVNARQLRLYELTSFAGELTERVGGLAVFSIVVWGTVVAWAGWFAVRQALFGLVY